jgi:protein-tyrosine phosphatase
MIDLHTHILPYFDDGAGSPEEAVAMARAAAEDGISHLVATPHITSLVGLERRLKALPGAVAALQAELDAVGVAIRIIAGAEVHMLAALVDAVKPNSPLTVGGLGRHVLLEPPFGPLPGEAEALVKRLRSRGIAPIIAHPERCAGIAEQPHLMQRLAAVGALAQITGDSLLLEPEHAIRVTAELLLTHGLAQFVASDAHSPHERPPALSGAAAASAALLGDEAAQRLVEHNPRLVLEGGEVPIEAKPLPPQAAPGRRGLLSRILGG